MNKNEWNSKELHAPPFVEKTFGGTNHHGMQIALQSVNDKMVPQKGNKHDDADLIFDGAVTPPKRQKKIFKAIVSKRGALVIQLILLCKFQKNNVCKNLNTHMLALENPTRSYCKI